ncbi:MAG: hypothetical protein ACP5H8_00785 [Candidatus Micrarchaeia archaeon]
MEQNTEEKKELEKPTGAKINTFEEISSRIKEKRALLLNKIDQIKELREKLGMLNKTGVRALMKRKEKLEFKIATEAITLERERELMKTIKGLEEEIKRVGSKEEERKNYLANIKVLNKEIEQLKNELDELKLEIIKMREERKKKRLEMRKRGEKKTLEKRASKAPEEFVINLEDIAVFKKNN